MTAGCHVTYSIELDIAEVIRAADLFFHDEAAKLVTLVAEASARFGISEHAAESLIDESQSIYDIDSNVEPENLGDAAWDVQGYTARAAKLLGFRAVSVSDEQGTAYMVDMLGREDELVRTEALEFVAGPAT